jgi:hypothetical protein
MHTSGKRELRRKLPSKPLSLTNVCITSCLAHNRLGFRPAYVRSNVCESSNCRLRWSQNLTMGVGGLFPVSAELPLLKYNSRRPLMEIGTPDLMSATAASTLD